MENNNYNNPFSSENNAPENVESPQTENVQAPVVEAPVEAPVEAVVEPVVEAQPTPTRAPSLTPRVDAEPEQALGFTATGAIGSLAADGVRPNISPASEIGNKVAVHSTKSVRWEEVGSISKGYNIVTQAQADKWLTRSHVRIATPEEVKKAFG